MHIDKILVLIILLIIYYVCIFYMLKGVLGRSETSVGVWVCLCLHVHHPPEYRFKYIYINVFFIVNILKRFYYLLIIRERDHTGENMNRMGWGRGRE